MSEGTRAEAERAAEAKFLADQASPLRRREAQLILRLGNISIATLRICLGIVFLLFGALKLFDGVSPAEEITERTMDKLTFGLLSGDTARLFVGLLEVAIGICLISGRWLRPGLVLLAIAGVGIIAPLFLFYDELFSGKHHAPTLLGQYVIKDIVLLAAGMVITAKVIAEQIAQPA
ncbi:MAG: DoxX family protein [Thermomicrobiales bacterium]|nr:DoxX family protein [Thermomicrobiales bacterium]